MRGLLPSRSFGSPEPPAQSLKETQSQFFTRSLSRPAQVPRAELGKSGRLPSSCSRCKDRKRGLERSEEGGGKQTRQQMRQHPEEPWTVLFRQAGTSSASGTEALRPIRGHRNIRPGLGWVCANHAPPQSWDWVLRHHLLAYSESKATSLQQACFSCLGLPGASEEARPLGLGDGLVGLGLTDRLASTSTSHSILVCTVDSLCPQKPFRSVGCSFGRTSCFGRHLRRHRPQPCLIDVEAAAVSFQSCYHKRLRGLCTLSAKA